MKQKKEIAVLAVLLVVAAIVWYFQHEKPTVTAGAVSAAQNYQPLPVENPRLHKEKIEKARNTEYRSTGRNIFSAMATPPPSARSEKRNIDARPHCCPFPVPPPPDPDPTLPGNIKFFGYGTVPNGSARRAFFSDGEDVYIVAEGEVLLNRYRILKVGNASLEFEEVSSGRHGKVMLEEQGTSPSA